MEKCEVCGHEMRDVDDEEWNFDVDYVIEITDKENNNHKFCSYECAEKLLGEDFMMEYFSEEERKRNIHTIDMNEVKINNDNHKHLGWVILIGNKQYDCNEEVMRFDTLQEAVQKLKKISLSGSYVFLGVELPYYYLDIYNMVIPPFNIHNDGIKTEYFNKHQDDVSLYRKFAAFTTDNVTGQYESWHITESLGKLKEACLDFHNYDYRRVGICEIIDFKKVGKNVYVPKIWITEGQKWINGWSTMMWD